jgi:flagellar biosynthesis protein FliQ
LLAGICHGMILVIADQGELTMSLIPKITVVTLPYFIGSEMSSHLLDLALRLIPQMREPL